MSLLIKNGRIITATEDYTADIYCEGETITKIGADLDAPADAEVIDAIAPGEDEIRLPKTSSSVFVSTNIDYVLRNLGVRQLVLAGLLTDQCVESAIRDACDLGYLVTQVTDACLTYSQERHDHSLRTIKGYCRQVTTDELIAELGQAS